MGTSFKNQVNAMLRKNAVYQRRNIGTNICLLSAPIFFCILLVVIQVVVNKLLLSSDDFKCGCKCTKCCPDNPAFMLALRAVNITVDVDGCFSQSSGLCPSNLGFSCKAKDKTKCGLTYSNGIQAAFCAIPYPSSFPGVAQIPKNESRAAFAQPAVPLLVSSSSPALTASLSSGLLPQPVLDNTSFIADMLMQLNSIEFGFQAHVLSQLGVQLGTSEDPGPLYFESAFVGVAEVLVPRGSCPTIASRTTSMYDFLKSYITKVRADNGTSAAALDVELRRRGFFDTDPSTTLPIRVTQIPVRCTEAPALSFADRARMNEEVYCGYFGAQCSKRTTYNNYTGGAFTNAYSAAWDFQDSSAKAMKTVVFFNDSESARRGGGGGPSDTLRLPALLNMAVRAWVQSAWGARSGQLVGVMAMPKPITELSLDFSSLLGPLFYTWVIQLLLPTFLQQLVYEKEKRLRMMMKMHGLGDKAYWAITYSWNLALYLVYMIIFVVFGGLVGLNMFSKTGGGIQAIFYFLFGNNLIAFAFMLSSLFSSSRTAVVFSFLYVFASGLIGELLLKNFINSKYDWMFFLQWVPAWSLYRGLYEQSEYTFLGVYKNTPGLQFSNLDDPNNGMRDVYGILAVEWAIFMILALYFEAVLSNGTGVRKHPLYFLDIFKKKHKPTTALPLTSLHALEMSAVGSTVATATLNSQGATSMRSKNHSSLNLSGRFDDVEAERQRVQSLTDYSDHPIVVRDLHKVYPAANGVDPKVAVRNLTLATNRGECFGLLGPNGAGKSTSINILVGFLEPTSGGAIVEGWDIQNDMDEIYRMMGVCPQHDLLWDQLTGREHLLFYGRLKGLTGAELHAAADAGLRSVNLFNAGVGNKQSRQYSGGMKRRLSVAISFMGKPKVVYLDEPSTGLDPASRRNLWEVVKAQKQETSIILTTHSMEEAEILCDRLGIFVDGQLVCIGNPKEITSRFAGYLVFTITVAPGSEEAAQALVLSMSPSAKMTYHLSGTLKYELPTTEVSLSKVFDAMNRVKHSGRIDILDWGVANATLEEVFIKLARESNAYTA